MATFFPLVVVPLILLQIVAGYFLSQEIDSKIRGSFEKFEGITRLLAKDSGLINYISNLSYDMKEEANVALDEFKITVNNYFKQSRVYQHLYFFNAQNKNLFSLSNKDAEKIKDPKLFLEKGKGLKKDQMVHLEQEHTITIMTVSLSESDEITGMVCLVLDSDLMIGAFKRRLRSIFFTMGGITLVTFILVVILTFVTASRLTRPISATNRMLEDMAKGQGDLTQRLTAQSSDELGHMAESFNRFVEQISNIIKEVMDVAAVITQCANDISQKSMELYSSTNEQNQSILETQDTLEKFSAIVNENSENSGEANSILESFNTEIQGKRDLVNNVTLTMSEITDSGKKIDNIISVINDISFQTNLLALNAAVEAARAGEAGRGFAVVASEVRNLAQKTAESSKTIQDIVSQNVETTNKGMKLVNETSTFFSSILQVVSDIVDRTSMISKSSALQGERVEQFNQSINNIDQSVNNIIQLVEKLSQSEQNLKENSSKLKGLVDKFKI